MEAAAVVVCGLLSGAEEVPDDRAASSSANSHAEWINGLPGHLLVAPPRSQGFGGDCAAISPPTLSSSADIAN